jgi:hypothetical protein
VAVLNHKRIFYDSDIHSGVFKRPSKKRQKPRKQAIKEAQVEVLNKAIASIKDDMRAFKTEEQRRGHYQAISTLSQIRDEL